MRRISRVALAVAICLVVASCGTRRSHDEVVAAAGGGSGGNRVTAGVGGAGASDGLGDAAGGDASAGSDAITAVGDTAVGGATSSAGSAGGADAGGAAAQRAAVAQGSSGAVRAKSPVRVGVVGTMSGAAGASLKPQADGVRVWAKAVNARGGVNGHPVEVLVADDGGDPARHRSLVQEFVEQRKVIAFLANPEALTGQGSVDYLTKAGVPVIGSEAAGQYFYSSPVYFPQGSHGNALSQASALVMATVAKEKGYTKGASITCVEVQVCRDAYATGPKLAAKYGMQVVYRAQASLGQPDFTAECLNARNAGAQVILIGMDANAVRAIAQSCARQGYKPMFALSAGMVIAAHAQDPNLAGALVMSSVAPWSVADTPGRKEFQDAMARFASGTPIAGGHMLGWVAGKVFELGAKDLPEPATPKALLEGLGRIHGDVLPDLTGPLLFSPGKPAEPSVCGFGLTIAGGRFVPALGGRRVCDTYDPSLFR